MVILGIDPGSVVTGYGVIESRDRKHKLLSCGCLRPDPKLPFPQRLLEIYDRLLSLIADTAPDEAAVEAVFYGANVQTMMKMCHARGTILLALANSDLPIFEYSPREVKKAVVGRGGASKEQVEFMVRSLFKLDRTPETHDVTDAVGIALCHSNRRALQGGRKGGRTRNDLADKLQAAGAFEKRPNRLEEKLKAMGATPRSGKSRGTRKGR